MEMIGVHSFSDRGPRENLEDRVCAFVLASERTCDWKVILAMGDGAGGQEMGEIAAEKGIGCLASRITAYLAAAPLDPQLLAPDAVLDAMVAAFRESNDAILRYASQNPRCRGMATTAVLAVIISGVLYVAWVGDSRCYVFGNGRLRRITRDHSVVQELIDQGLLTPRNAKEHPAAHVIKRYLGNPAYIEAETQTCRLAPSDLVLLSTDGLTDVLSDEQIADILRDNRRESLEELPAVLAREALRRGTADNVTILCWKNQRSVTPPVHSRTRTDAYAVRFAQSLQNVAIGE